jgi:hypothetical protein
MYLFYKTSYPNEEVNCTEPSPSVSVPCLWPYKYKARLERLERDELTS